MTILRPLDVARHAVRRADDRDPRGGGHVRCCSRATSRRRSCGCRRPAARWPPARSILASARRSLGAATRSERWRATSTRWPSASKRWSPRRRRCCATSRTSSARRSRASAWRSRSRSGAPARQSQPDLARIEREAERLDALVGQVMTLTRLRTTDAPRRDIVRLDTLVGEVVDDARFEYPDAKVEYAPAREVSLRGDADGLKSAIENVVRNALIYGDRSKPIEVRLDAAGDRATVRVLDRGPGVPDAELEADLRAVLPHRQEPRPPARRPRHRPRDHGSRDGAARRQGHGAESGRGWARDRHRAPPRPRTASTSLEAVAPLLVQNEVEALVLLLGRRRAAATPGSRASGSRTSRRRSRRPWRPRR